jgi:tRNA(Ile)-lysidine synthase
VAVSGGPDSVALLHAVKAMPYALVVGHVDHGLRKNSGRDARFVERLARGWDLPCLVQRENVKAYARGHGFGMEEAAREVRYRALAAIAKKTKCSAILAAHTADDQAETVLMNFLRGSGTAGLSGMAVERELNHGSGLVLVRPLLGVRRGAILAYLRSHSLPYRLDPTNQKLTFARNRIRHSTLPYLERRSAGLRERLTQGADIFRQEEDYWNGQVAQVLGKTVRRNGARFTVVLPRLLGYHKALSRRILRHVLPGSSFQDIEQVYQLARSPEEAGLLELPGQWRVSRKKQTLTIMHKRRG